MSQITVLNLTFAYPGSYDNIFENVSFTLDTEWKLGLIGRNGRGKTTFLRLLMGDYEYKGSIKAGLQFSYFPYHVTDMEQSALTIIESKNPDFQLWELEREISLLEMDEELLYRPFSTLSNGEQTRLLLASLFLNESHFLLIDEPTNHLDLIMREKVAAYLKSKSGFILISHDRSFLDGCVDHIMSINRTNIDVQQGDFSSWWLNKQRQDEYELAENAHLKQDIKRLNEAARRNATWSDKVEKTKLGNKNSGVKGDKGYVGAQAARMMKRSKSIETRREDAVQEKSRLLHNIEESTSLELRPLKYHAQTLLELDKVNLQYDGRIVSENISLRLESGDRIAVMGKNGSGKSSLLKLLIGENIQHDGYFRRGSQLIISYLPQDTSFLSGSLDDFIKSSGTDQTLFKSFLRKLDFSRLQFAKDMASYSAGQKKKVLLAKSLSENAHLYVWDEPLNYIDVISRIQIEDLLKKHQPTIIFVEHDRSFCENTATREIHL